MEARPEPKGRTGFIPTARGRVKAKDVDSSGHFGLAAMVHRFTDSCLQAGAAIGMDAALSAVWKTAVGNHSGVTTAVSPAV